MKKISTYFLIGLTVLLTQTACNNNSKKESMTETKEEASANYAYSVSLMLDTSAKNAPALQSFAHGTSGSDWIMFAGRTNDTNSLIGGVHDMLSSGNYANTSFLPKSYNQNIFVYNRETDSVWTLGVNSFFALLRNKFPEKVTTGLAGQNLYNAFVNSNPLATQDEDGFLYSVGGYGSIANQDKSTTYMTFGQVIRLHLPSMVKLVKGLSLSDDEWLKLFRYGTNDGLKSTGAELFDIDGTYYMAGGHNFGANAPNGGQKYLDAVYPFTLDISDDSFLMTVNMGDAISDVPDPKADSSDDISTFRRRDGPVIPSIFKNAGGDLIEGFTFYGGVFKPGPDSALQAWNDAIYVHPGGKANYELDTDYNQGDYNVYACASFAGYDSNTDVVHTFLMGGIGSGEISVPSRLSSFSNTAVHIEMDLSSEPSSSMTVSSDIFGTGGAPYYGAECIFDRLDDIPQVSVSDGTSEVIDLASAFGSENSIVVGYIHGGIEAFQKDPGTFGSGNSAASNKVWKVMLTRTAQ